MPLRRSLSHREKAAREQPTKASLAMPPAAAFVVQWRGREGERKGGRKDPRSKLLPLPPPPLLYPGAYIACGGGDRGGERVLPLKQRRRRARLRLCLSSVDCVLPALVRLTTMTMTAAAAARETPRTINATRIIDRRKEGRKGEIEKGKRKGRRERRHDSNKGIQRRSLPPYHRTAVKSVNLRITNCSCSNREGKMLNSSVI